jgi:hypothetical protein
MDESVYSGKVILAPEVYKFAKRIFNDHNTLDPWDWSLINFTLEAFVFMDKFIHGIDERFGSKMH